MHDNSKERINFLIVFTIYTLYLYDIMGLAQSLFGAMLEMTPVRSDIYSFKFIVRIGLDYITARLWQILDDIQS